MKTIRFLCILCVSSAAFALPATAQNGRQTTPASLPMCDDLADKTPGLQGLCVALCEAQTCVAEVTEAGDVEYGPGCDASAPRLLANYTKLARPERGDPQYPSCVTVQCPCWTREELTEIGGGDRDQCFGAGTGDTGWAWLQGGAPDRSVGEYAIANGGSCASASAGRNPVFLNGSRIGSAAHGTCVQTLRDECAARGQSLP